MSEARFDLNYVGRLFRAVPARGAAGALRTGWFRKTVPHISKKTGAGLEAGFTLLEVLVSLTVLAVGAALTLSLISGSLGNIRKVQLRTRTVEHAEAVMELALLNDAIQQPTSFTGDFEDGTRWTVRVEDYTLPVSDRLPPRNSPQTMQVKLLCYTVEMFSPESRTSDYRLQTLKLVKTTPQDQRMGIQ